MAVALLTDLRIESVLERYFPRAFRRKKQGQIEVNFELLQYLLQGEHALRIQEAIVRRDARMFTRAKRDYEIKAREDRKRRDYLLRRLSQGEE